MKIDERSLIGAPIDAVWPFVRNPQTVAPCIPGCEAVEQLSDKLFRGTIGVALGPIKACFNVVVEITEEFAPNSKIMRAAGARELKLLFDAGNVLSEQSLAEGDVDRAFATCDIVVQPIAAALALKTKKPVKVVLSREDDFGSPVPHARLSRRSRDAHSLALTVLGRRNSMLGIEAAVEYLEIICKSFVDNRGIRRQCLVHIKSSSGCTEPFSALPAIRRIRYR
jgi:carbon monoxide dehydrogenase subunit G